MRPPVPISTLSDAAKWMSELSGATMTEREVLGHAFNFQWAAERPRGEGDEPAAQGITAAAREAERIVQVIIPRDVEMRLRQWRLDGYTDRPVTQAERIIALDSYELFDLLTYDCTELNLPRLTDPYEGDEYAEIVLDGAMVNQAQVRICARGLYILAAWWQSTVGAAGREAPDDTAAPARAIQGYIPSPAKRKEPAGGDTLTALIWSVCYDLAEAGQRASPVPVMAELKVRASDPDARRKGSLLSAVAGGVKWEDASGEQKELTMPQLEARVGEWRKAVSNG
ncbi:hypothetical protein [Massilia sp. PWRC2]|uniref:hypothetical protein n=1 Tax=Massilia sp. PWRC2 TaxID=2804626 RepID=UPI003CEAE341